MRGPKETMVIIAEVLGARCPKANPSLSDPAAALAIDLYDALGMTKQSDLRRMVLELGLPSRAAKRPLKEIKRVVNRILEIDVEGVDVEDPTAAWKMWPSVLTKKERSMATSKQATKRKTASKKKVSKKKASKKKVARRSGNKGKPATAKLKKPVNKDSKRGKVLAKFMGKSGKTPDAAARELKTNRSNVLSHLHDLNRYHGIGYVLSNGDPVKILKPKGCKNVWA